MGVTLYLPMAPHTPTRESSNLYMTFNISMKCRRQTAAEITVALAGQRKNCLTFQGKRRKIIRNSAHQMTTPRKTDAVTKGNYHLI